LRTLFFNLGAFFAASGVSPVPQKTGLSLQFLSLASGEASGIFAQSLARAKTAKRFWPYGVFAPRKLQENYPQWLYISKCGIAEAPWRRFRPAPKPRARGKRGYSEFLKASNLGSLTKSQRDTNSQEPQAGPGQS
jgi:hypothetical protein